MTPIVLRFVISSRHSRIGVFWICRCGSGWVLDRQWTYGLRRRYVTRLLDGILAVLMCVGWFNCLVQRICS